ncbi:hypothetical protein Hdeb2414_s0001g00038291 [Helianthus debilis subsp. tardiflorus]
MHPFNRGFIPPRSSADPNQSGNPTRPVSPVPTRPNPFGSGFLDYKSTKSRVHESFEPTAIIGLESLRVEPESKHRWNGAVSSVRVGSSFRHPTKGKRPHKKKAETTT